MAHRLHRLAVGCLVLLWKPLVDQLLAGAWVLTFGHPREVFWAYLARQPKVLSEAALPFTAYVLALGVVRLRAAGELLHVIPLRLSRTQRTRDSKHQSK